MLSSILKFDLYKTVKSKGFITCWIIAILFCLMQPMSIYLFGGDNDSVIRNLSFSRALDLAVIVFACLLWSKDYSSGYIKNVYCIVDKWKYVLSKFICLVLFCIAYVIMEFLFELFFNYVFGIGVFIDAEYGCTIWHFLIKTCAYILLGLKVGTFCFFLSNCCKSGIATIVVVLVYYAFLGYQVRNLIDSIIDLIFPSNEFSIVTYSIFGGTVDAVGYSIDGVFNTWRMVFERKILPDFIVQSLYIILFTVCNYLLMKKRNV